MRSYVYNLTELEKNPAPFIAEHPLIKDKRVRDRLVKKTLDDITDPAGPNGTWTVQQIEKNFSQLINDTKRQLHQIFLAKSDNKIERVPVNSLGEDKTVVETIASVANIGVPLTKEQFAQINQAQGCLAGSQALLVFCLKVAGEPIQTTEPCIRRVDLIKDEVSGECQLRCTEVFYQFGDHRQLGYKEVGKPGIQWAQMNSTRYQAIKATISQHPEATSELMVKEVTADGKSGMIKIEPIVFAKHKLIFNKHNLNSEYSVRYTVEDDITIDDGLFPSVRATSNVSPASTRGYWIGSLVSPIIHSAHFFGSYFHPISAKKKLEKSKEKLKEKLKERLEEKSEEKSEEKEDESFVLVSPNPSPPISPVSSLGHIPSMAASESDRSNSPNNSNNPSPSGEEPKSRFSGPSDSKKR